MKMVRSLDPAFDRPEFMMSRPSLNLGNGGRVISSRDGFLSVVVDQCKALT